MPTAAAKRYAERALSARSRCSKLENPSNIPAACRCRRPQVSCLALTAWSLPAANISKSKSLRFRSTAVTVSAPSISVFHIRLRRLRRRCAENDTRAAARDPRQPCSATADLAMDRDVAGRCVDINASVAMAPVLAVANYHIRVRAGHTARHAGAVIANLAADPFGIGGVRERKPQGCRCDADQEFGHRQPPLRPRGQHRLRPAVLIAERRFGSVLSAAARGALIGRAQLQMLPVK